MGIGHLCIVPLHGQEIEIKVVIPQMFKDRSINIVFNEKAFNNGKYLKGEI